MILSNANVVILVNSLVSMRKAGPHRIATELRAHGYSCQIIDAAWYFSQSEIQQVLDLCVGPDTKIVAWSSSYSPSSQKEQFFSVGMVETLPIHQHNTFVIDYAKKLNPNIKFVVGGPTSYVREADDGIDTIFYGMADRAIVEYVKFLENKNPFFQYSINQHGKMIVDGDAYNIHWNFNQSSIEYRNEDNIPYNSAATIEVARGCIFKCDFCAYSLNGKKNNEYIKYKEILKLELIENYSRYGIKKYIVGDDTFNDNNIKLQMIADIAQSLPFQLELACYLRIDLIRAHPDQYLLLKDAGVVGAFFGIESLNHQSVKSIGKGLHPDRVIEELYRFQDRMPACGTVGSFIVGLPHETIDTQEETKRKLLDHQFPIDSIRISPLVLNVNRRTDLSEFEKNTSKYFLTDPQLPGWWHNGQFDIRWAHKFCDNFVQEMLENNRNRIGGFQTIALQNYWKDIPLAKQSCANYNITVNQQFNQLNEYKNMLFNM
jgi:Radical SAM superfamily